MRRLNALPKKPWFGVDEFACMRAAERIKGFKAKAPAPIEAGSEDSLLFLLVFIAIFHDINWDFLFSRLLDFFYGENRLNPGVFLERLVHLKPKVLEEILQGYEKPERINAVKRCSFLRDLEKVVISEFDGKALGIVSSSNNSISGSEGFLFQLDKFRAFREDPLRKKSNVLLHEIVKRDLVTFRDPQAVEPAVDYHIIRIYLRSGRVYPVKLEILEQLRSDLPSPRNSMIAELRSAVSSAMKRIALMSKIGVPHLNYLEWQLGRAICVRGVPACVGGKTDRSVEDDVRQLSQSVCPFMDFCLSYYNRSFMEMKEPKSRKSYY